MSGMQISASGVLMRAASRLAKTRDMGHLAHPLELLYDHLCELKRRTTSGDEQDAGIAVREFFGTWTDLDEEAENTKGGAP